MIKAKLNTGAVVLGLSNENIKRLQEGKPIVLNLKDMGLPEQEIMIFSGETEDIMYEQLLDQIDLNKTKIHFDKEN